MSNLDQLSDEEILAMESLPEATEGEETSKAQVEETDTPQPEEVHQEAGESGTEAESEAQEPESSKTENVEQGQSLEASEEADVQLQEPNFKEFYETLTKPFKANGREIQITNADDFIRLAQMGVNYSKKMEHLKPNLSLLKMLEKNGLNNAEELAFLVDLKNKKPEAIAKYVRDNDIDLYETDISIADNYTPSVPMYETSNFEMVLEEVLNDNPKMNEVMQEMSKWDNESKSILYEQPAILQEISRQKANGFYDEVVSILDRERLLGRLTDMTYLQAYAHIETMLMEREKQTESFVAPRPTQQTTVATDKKRQAAVPQNHQKAANLNEINLAALSDEEILKLTL